MCLFIFDKWRELPFPRTLLILVKLYNDQKVLLRTGLLDLTLPIPAWTCSQLLSFKMWLLIGKDVCCSSFNCSTMFHLFLHTSLDFDRTKLPFSRLWIRLSKGCNCLAVLVFHRITRTSPRDEKSKFDPSPRVAYHHTTSLSSVGFRQSHWPGVSWLEIEFVEKIGPKYGKPVDIVHTGCQCHGSM